MMPSLAEVLRYFSGALQLMAGRPEGLRRLDLSADGFWSSFSAIGIALPGLALSWFEFETINHADAAAAPAGTVYAAHAMADLVGWLLPPFLLVLIARRIGFSRKILPLVVSLNWGVALFVWLTIPFYILLLIVGTNAVTTALELILTIAFLTAMVRLAAASIGGDLSAGIGVVLLMVISNLLAYGAVMDLTGVRLL